MAPEGALNGLKVIDFGQYIAGPLLAMLLADAGAEVIHVDPPGGPRWDDPANAVLQRGKRSIELDLKTAAGVDSALDLVRHADMLVENFRPGVMGRLGLGYDAIQAANPRLVYCSIPGFSGDDARASMRGWEGIVSAATSIYRPPRRFGPAGPITDTDPSFTATPLLSTYAAAIAAHTVVAALLARDLSGRGQRVEVSLFDAAYEVFGHELQMAHNMSSGAFKPPPRPGLGHYKCKDGRWLHLCLFEDRHMRWFAQEFVPEWLAEGVAEPDRLRADPELQVELIKRFTELFQTRDAAQWEHDINERHGGTVRGLPDDRRVVANRRGSSRQPRGRGRGRSCARTDCPARSAGGAERHPPVAASRVWSASLRSSPLRPRTERRLASRSRRSTASASSTSRMCSRARLPVACSPSTAPTSSRSTRPKTARSRGTCGSTPASARCCST